MIKGKQKLKVLTEVIMSIIGIAMMVPVYIMVINSIKNQREAALMGIGFPTEIRLDNYIKVFIQGKVLSGYKNSLIITICTIVIMILISTMASFVIQRRKNKFTRISYIYLILGLVLPIQIIPLIKLLMILNLHNTYLGIIFYYCAVYAPFSVFLVAGFMSTIPAELDEASTIDGCSALRLFFNIIFPISKTVVITLGLLLFFYVWNDFMGPFFIVSDIKKWTIPLSVFNFITKYNSRWEFVFADMVFVVAPVIAINIFAQRYIIEGMTAGAIKG